MSIFSRKPKPFKPLVYVGPPVRIEPGTPYVPRHGSGVESIPATMYDNQGLHRPERTCKMQGGTYGTCCPYSGRLTRFMQHGDWADWEGDLMGIDLPAEKAVISDIREAGWSAWKRGDDGTLEFASIGNPIAEAVFDASL